MLKSLMSLDAMDACTSIIRWLRLPLKGRDKSLSAKIKGLSTSTSHNSSRAFLWGCGIRSSKR